MPIPASSTGTACCRKISIGWSGARSILIALRRQCHGGVINSRKMPTKRKSTCQVVREATAMTVYASYGDKLFASRPVCQLRLSGQQRLCQQLGGQTTTGTTGTPVTGAQLSTTSRGVRRLSLAIPETTTGIRFRHLQTVFDLTDDSKATFSFNETITATATKTPTTSCKHRRESLLVRKCAL